jgi:hypothetical protein
VPEVVESAEEKAARLEREAHDEARSKALSLGILGAALLAVGVASPEVRLTEELTTLALAGLVGYNLVWGVSHSLHSPLMSVTNAISGMTAVGGLLLMDRSLVPHSVPGWLAALSVGLSCVNIFGGFVVGNPSNPTHTHTLSQCLVIHRIQVFSICEYMLSAITPLSLMLPLSEGTGRMLRRTGIYAAARR